METTPGWCTWWVSAEYLPSAMNQLDEAGIDMQKVKLVYNDGAGGRYAILVVYKNE